MEAERRSTMSSLKGQLSNVEGSVKTMKATVVVGSVLTVACLAAVFGVTLAANEVSKEVKVSNGTLVSKSGAGVLTSSGYVTAKGTPLSRSFTTEVNGAKVSCKVNAWVEKAGEQYFVADEAVLSSKGLAVKPDTLLSVTLEGVEKRSLNGPAVACTLAWYWCIMIGSLIARGVAYAVTWLLDNAAHLLSEFWDMLGDMEGSSIGAGARPFE